MNVRRIPPKPAEYRYVLTINHEEAGDIIYALQNGAQRDNARANRMIEALGGVMRAERDEDDTEP